MRVPGLSILTLTLLAISACGAEAPSTPPQETTSPLARAQIAAVNSPLCEFTRRLAGDRADTWLAAPQGGDPAQWRPGVEDILRLQQVDLLVLNGAGYSGWLDKVSLNSLRLLPTTSQSQWLRLPGQVTHSHGPEGEHAHGDYAFTTWMDLSLAAQQASAIHAALSERWPDAGAELDTALALLAEELEAIDRGYRAAADSLRGRPVVYSHPVYQYFERRYRLPGHSLHWEPDMQLTEAALAQLQPHARENALFVWESEPSAANRAALSDLGIDQVVVDPGANLRNGDWLALQRENLERLAALVDE